MSNREAEAQPVSPSMQMMQILWPGAMAVQAIHVAAKFALADLIAGGPKSLQELAEATHTHGSSLGRLLRALTSLGIFVEDEAGRYRQTALSDTLRSDHPKSLRPFAMMLGAHFVWKPCGALEETVRTGQPSFELVYGAPFFEYLAGHSDDAQVFNAAMSSSPDHLVAIAGAYDFSKFGTNRGCGRRPWQPSCHNPLCQPSLVRSALRPAHRSLRRIRPAAGADKPAVRNHRRRLLPRSSRRSKRVHVEGHYP